MEQREIKIKESVDFELENFDKNLIIEMDKMIKASMEEGKSGKMPIISSIADIRSKRIQDVAPKLSSSIKSMSQIERDYKEVKASNILDKEYSHWYSYKR